MITADNKKIFSKVFQEDLLSVEELEEKYPVRNLKEGAKVTRFGPSPTGFMHIGGLYTSLVCERLAHQSEGVFYLRIEDTDRDREVEGAVEKIVNSLAAFGINYDEGSSIDLNEAGEYGPYTQSERKKIYHSCIKHLLEKEKAYLCFSTKEELSAMREKQESESVKPGCYGKWAVWRDRSSSDVLKMIEGGADYVVRLKAEGNGSGKIKFTDLILGEREFPENDQDVVLMKSDGFPTYHMAHVVDDYLMRTTHVVRGNEWLPSLPIHLQIFMQMGWKPPKYAHIAPIQKLDEESKRKLSKRKDPEADVDYYTEAGYPAEAVKEYLLNLANSNFEDWRKNNPEKDYRDFPLTVKKLAGSSGPLLDINKLNDISKDIVAGYSSEQIYDKGLSWSARFDVELHKMFVDNEEYVKEILGIEREDSVKKRKDIAKWSDLKEEIFYYFDTHHSVSKEDIERELGDISIAQAKVLAESFKSLYSFIDDQAGWFEKMKKIAAENGYADNIKEYKSNPENFKGSIVDVTRVFRVLLTGKPQSPDLYSVMQVMGQERVFRRVDKLLNL